MRHHKLSLCGEHYEEWVLAQTDRAIEKYKMFTRDERVLIAVSGGKDSLALWDVLLRLGYQADGLYIALGINAPLPYSDASLEKTRKFVDSGPWTVDSDDNSQYAIRNFAPTLHVVDIPATYGKTIPEIARAKMRGQGRPCAACGLTKRYVMNRLALEKRYTVLATGHNLDDEIAVLFQNTLRWQTGYL
ncbi:MAG: hypothetical protein L0Y55_10860, partial [Anaerolineales bacterium]|nr:hypothetical protein [Anaerolineales bacterium]